MSLRVIPYLTPLPVIIAATFAFTGTGWVCYAPLLYAWVFIPLVELFLPPDTHNLTAEEEARLKNNPWFDWVLYAMVVAHLAALWIFLQHIADPSIHWVDRIGRIGTMGLLCGTFGINIGHELGHRSNRWEQRLAILSLLTSLYTHFFIEHNKGHHRHVATLQDPSSARFGESLYAFWPRTLRFTWLSAWEIAADENRKKDLPIWHWRNQMLQLQTLQLVWVGAIGFRFGLTTLFYYLLAAIIGMLLLETVNYIEHYGLSRKKKPTGQYERTQPHHSWNSNHLIGRLMLFELSRHSDHHYLASRKYQILRHHATAPQMPTGYPGMMILALFPPLWFSVMNKKVESLPQG